MWFVVHKTSSCDPQDSPSRFFYPRDANCATHRRIYGGGDDGDVLRAECCNGCRYRSRGSRHLGWRLCLLHTREHRRHQLYEHSHKHRHYRCQPIGKKHYCNTRHLCSLLLHPQSTSSQLLAHQSTATFPMWINTTLKWYIAVFLWWLYRSLCEELSEGECYHAASFSWFYNICNVTLPCRDIR